ncbi:MAG TPA: DUF2961 domain-containing protein [Phycisphaerae bacterium]|nr:DUF2961 domain-containing protein [Phycisphaerae bacterium]HRY68440.1 DUF2961 domain-containing protein [Phycisphaerae bacterium]HSA28525.1 DUF2961 domain-containing protein [Phycisphaerae bacterium]
MRRHPTLAARTAATMVILVCGPTAIADNGQDELYRLQDVRTGRSSSSDLNWQTGNGDCRYLKAGDTVTIADIHGPGVIRHIWFTIAAEDPKYGRSLTLRMFWDGQDQPAVEAPLGDFFAVGHGLCRNVISELVAVSSEGRAYNCYWPMPFRKHARITLTNDSKKFTANAIYFQVDYDKMPSLPADAAYFHAQYRQEYPAKKGQNYLLLDTEGAGLYVGTVLSSQARSGGWFGEGDDFFYIDGEKEPTIKGTGTEDYFNDAWGFREFMRPYYGVVIWEGYDVGDRCTAYRWHTKDPVRFTKSLRVEIEHKGGMFDDAGKLVSGYEERSDLYSSVAFWYQTGVAKRFASMPPVEERTVPAIGIELESAKADVRMTPADTRLEIQEGGYSANKQLFVQFAGQESTLAVPIKLDKPIEGLAHLKLTKSHDYGTWKVSLDGKTLKGMDAVDLYSPTIVSQDFKVGSVKLDAGTHELKFECAGKNAASKGYFLGADAVTIEAITLYAVPAKR